MVDDLFEIEPSGAGDDDKQAILLRVHVQPGAGRTAVSGRYGDALKVRVAAPPEGGRANAASRSFLADLFGVPESQVELTSGPSSRSKRFRISGVEAQDVRRILEGALAEATGGGRPGGPPGRPRGTH
jgi:uncharacterized protein (TIGR00251 family)